MKIVGYYSPANFTSRRPDIKVCESLLVRELRDQHEVFVLPLPRLDKELPVGCVVRFITDVIHHDESDPELYGFKVAEVSYNPTNHPDIIFLRLQLAEWNVSSPSDEAQRTDPAEIHSFLAFLRKTQDTTVQYLIR